MTKRLALFAAILLLTGVIANAADLSLGDFTDTSDIGRPARPVPGRPVTTRPGKSIPSPAAA